MDNARIVLNLIKAFREYVDKSLDKITSMLQCFNYKNLKLYPKNSKLFIKWMNGSSLLKSVFPKPKKNPTDW